MGTRRLAGIETGSIAVLVMSYLTAYGNLNLMHLLCCCPSFTNLRTAALIAFSKIHIHGDIRGQKYPKLEISVIKCPVFGNFINDLLTPCPITAGRTL